MKRLGLLALLGAFLTIIGREQAYFEAPLFQQEKVLLQVPYSDSKDSKDSKEIIVRNGELVIKPKSKGTIILLHGFKGDKDSMRALRILFPHYNTFIFDFRAHGDNTQGQCCSFGAYERLDVKAAVEYVKSHPLLKDKPVFAYGISMGAVSALEAQAYYGDLFDAIIADSPFDSVESVIERGLKKVNLVVAGYDLVAPLRDFFKKHSFDQRIDQALRFVLSTFAGMNASTTRTCLKPVSPYQSITKVTVPTLLIGCAKDEQVPLDAVRAIHEKSPGSTQLWIAPGRRHIDAFFANPEEYQNRVNLFFDQVVANNSLAA